MKINKKERLANCFTGLSFYFPGKGSICYPFGNYMTLKCILTKKQVLRYNTSIIENRFMGRTLPGVFRFG